MNFPTQGKFIEHLGTHKINIPKRPSKDLDFNLKPVVFLSVF